MPKDANRYTVKSLVHASRVLSAFESQSEVLRLRDVAVRTGFTKGMWFRLLYTLKFCGFLKQVGPNQYRRAGVSNVRSASRCSNVWKTYSARGHN